MHPLRQVMKRVLPLALVREVSIGILTGKSPLALGDPAEVANPVLTRLDVTDMLASFVADPFMIRVDGRWHLFFEAFRISGLRPGERKGEIAVATSRDGLRWDYQRSVLAEPFHLSYPHVFEWNSDFYMIPESYQAGAVRLYRAEEFPFRWGFVANLLEGPVFLDSSVFRHDGRWWMLTETSPARRNDTLRLFHATDLLGPWVEHPSSPIVRGDPRIARPAGRVLSGPGRLLRFAQDCSGDYGASVRGVEITRLTPNHYQEVECGQAPLLAGSGRGWNQSGMHHLDAHELGAGRWMACTDGWTNVRGPRQLAAWLRSRRG
jgi:hypothetical protein